MSSEQQPVNPYEKEPPMTHYRRPMYKTIGYIIALILGIIYIINPGAGVIELIPDNIPIIGNLDEAGVASLMVLIIQKLRSGEY